MTSSPAVYGPRFGEALEYAAALHAGQRRKGNGAPYVGHLLGAASIVIDAGGDEDEAIAALLHDGPEDQGGRRTLDLIAFRFGARVGEIVEGCSDSLAADPDAKEAWLPRKIAHLGRLGAREDGSVLLVSAADKLHNVRSTVSDYRVHGEALWERFAGGKAGTIKAYRSLLAIYEGAQDARVLRVAADLREALAALEAACGAADDPSLADGAGLTA